MGELRHEKTKAWSPVSRGLGTLARIALLNIIKISSFIFNVDFIYISDFIKENKIVRNRILNIVYSKYCNTCFS